jgi:hypothetical protein
MRDDEGYIILHNGVRRTFRDKRETAFQAARYAKARPRARLSKSLTARTGAKFLKAKID